MANGTNDINQVEGREVEILSTLNQDIDTNVIRHLQVETFTEVERFRSPKLPIPNSSTKKSTISKTPTGSGRK